MVMKRQPGEEREGEGDVHLQNKRHHFCSTLFKGVSSSRTLQDHMPILETIIRKCVKEEVNRALDLFLGTPGSQIGSSGSRTLQLQFPSNLPHIVYTGNKIVSEDGSPMKLALHDSVAKRIVTSGLYSSMKVEIVVLEGDFVPDSLDDWSKKDFDSKVVHNREGKRPLIAGESIVSLQDGIGYIGDVSFTDNSSWTRSGKFRLGVKVHSCIDDSTIREGISKPFRVKDQRGEFNRKHHPPLLDDEVWRLEKIAKDGTPHKLLTESGISCVRDFLRAYTMNEVSLRAVFGNVSNKKWETIIRHATTSPLDDKEYIYRTAQWTGLVFNSIYKAVRVTFDGHSFLSVDGLNTYQMRAVEGLKQRAYKNLNSWEDWEAVPNLIPQNPNLHVGQDGVEMQMNINHPTISVPHEVEKDNSSFELGESSSQMQELNLTFNNIFGMSGSPESFYNGEQTWPPGQLSPQDFTVDNNFEEG